jgi:putative polyhydroxyalkanoate system protein
MSNKIDIRHSHALPKAQARQAIEEIAHKLQERFDVKYAWEGDVLRFSRAGVEGTIELLEQGLHVHAKLGFLAAMFKEPIEAEIRRVLATHF